MVRKNEMFVLITYGINLPDTHDKAEGAKVEELVCGVQFDKVCPPVDRIEHISVANEVRKGRGFILEDLVLLVDM